MYDATGLHGDCRVKGVNAAGLCEGHACPVRNCAFSKSSTEQLCPTHKTMSEMKLPKNWDKVCYMLPAPVFAWRSVFCLDPCPG